MPVVDTFFEPLCKQKPSAETRLPCPDSASAQHAADSTRAKPNAIQNSEAGVSTSLDDLERFPPDRDGKKPACRQAGNKPQTKNNKPTSPDFLPKGWQKT
jgi:hypothetical protein